MNLCNAFTSQHGGGFETKLRVCLYISSFSQAVAALHNVAIIMIIIIINISNIRYNFYHHSSGIAINTIMLRKKHMLFKD